MTTPQRRSTVLAAAVTGLVASSLLLAGPASAEPAEGWPEQQAVDPLHAILVVAGIPLLLFVVIAILVYLPALVRGERIAPGAPTVEDQWLGGPRKAHGELAGPDTETSAAGGASGRW